MKADIRRKHTARIGAGCCWVGIVIVLFMGSFGTVLAEPAIENLSILVPAEHGGGLDLTARALGEVLQSNGAVGSVELEYSPGAGGLIGLADFISSRKGQGNALMVGSLFTVGAVVPNRAAVTLLDSTPIARLTWDDTVIAVPATSRIHTASDLIEALSSVPDSVSWVGGSSGGVDQMLLLQLAKELGVASSRLHYTALPGGGEVGTALLGGKYTAGLSGYSEFEDLVKEGKLRILLVTSKGSLNDTGAPSFDELGLKIDRLNWRGVFAAPGIDADQRAVLIDLMEQVVASEEWKRRLKEYHWRDAFLAGREFRKFVQSEQSRAASDFLALQQASGSDGKIVNRVLARRYVWAIVLGVLSILLIAMMYVLQSSARHREAGLQDAFERATGMANLRAEELERALAGIHAQIDAEFDNWQLSSAERDIALLMLKGLRFKDIAEARGTSERTVRQQAQMVYRKSGLKGRSDLAAFFIEDFMQSINTGSGLDSDPSGPDSS